MPRVMSKCGDEAALVRQAPLMPAKAGIQKLMELCELHWVPAFAGTSGFCCETD